MKTIFVQYPKCSTCIRARKYLESKGVDFESRSINEDKPNKDELKSWIDKSGLPITKFFNTSGKLYREMGLKDKVKIASENELLEILSSDGMLVKRPILVEDDRVLVGFKEEEWNK